MKAPPTVHVPPVDDLNHLDDPDDLDREQVVGGRSPSARRSATRVPSVPRRSSMR
ncbi:hypothetical protein ACH40E_35565 [Streptomyces acidicola]|uniref:hypothetical protein n=1 Tax=Streptomyces acidicola TaxID=2596892 RepID=UPI003790512F